MYEKVRYYADDDLKSCKLGIQGLERQWLHVISRGVKCVMHGRGRELPDYHTAPTKTPNLFLRGLLSSPVGPP
ncbi:hypothetical protein J6590_077856 [Homalodisca vitripennis]|nr:hypothetical protein J6590_077856 [Homalodisca vitripennis]